MSEKTKTKKRTFAQGIKFQTEQNDRNNGRIVVASGTKSRNRDYYTGKPYRLVPSGMRFDAWGKTGLVLYMHNFNIPLGRNSLYLEDGKLYSPDAIDFHRMVVPIATTNWIGDAIGEFDTGVIADLWEDLYLNSVSIHIMMTLEDEENIVELEDEILIPTSEVIEYSVVTVPGDREANRERLLSMGLDPAFVECVTCSEINQRKSGLQTPEPVIHLVDGETVVVGSGTKSDEVDATSSIQLEVRDMEVKEQDVEVTEEGDLRPLVQETHIEIEVPEEEFAEVLEEEETVIPILEMAEALAEDEEALKVLARAFASNPAIISIFVEGLQENAGFVFAQELQAVPQVRKIRFVSSAKPTEPVEPKQENPRPQTLKALQQTPPNPDYSGRDPKRRQRVIGMIRTP